MAHVPRPTAFAPDLLVPGSGYLSHDDRVAWTNNLMLVRRTIETEPDSRGGLKARAFLAQTRLVDAMRLQDPSQRDTVLLQVEDTFGQVMTGARNKGINDLARIAQSTLEAIYITVGQPARRVVTSTSAPLHALKGHPRHERFPRLPRQKAGLQKSEYLE